MTAPFSKRWPALAVAMVSVAMGACSDDPDPRPDDPCAETAPSSVILIERVNLQGGGRTYYASVLDSVPGAAVDRTKALQLESGDADIFNERLYVRNRAANTITRYCVAADRTLAPDGEVSFGNLALTAPGRLNNAFLANDRAYLFDPEKWRMLGWNPSTMELNGEAIAIDNMKKDATLPGQISAPVRVGNRLISAISWSDTNNSQLKTYPGSGVMIIDLASPTTPQLIEDPQLGGAFRVVADPTGNGDVYVVGVLNGAMRLFGKTLGGDPNMPPQVPDSGVIRLAAGATAFDGGSFKSLEGYTGTQGAWAVHLVDKTTLLTQVYDPAIMTKPADALAFQRSTDFVFGFVDLANAANNFEPVAALPRGQGANAGNHIVDGKLYIQVAKADQSGAEVFAVSGKTITKAFEVPAGDVFFLQRFK